MKLLSVIKSAMVVNASLRDANKCNKYNSCILSKKFLNKTMFVLLGVMVSVVQRIRIPMNNKHTLMVICSSLR